MTSWVTRQSELELWPRQVQARPRRLLRPQQQLTTMTTLTFKPVWMTWDEIEPRIFSLNCNTSQKMYSMKTKSNNIEKYFLVKKWRCGFCDWLGLCGRRSRCGGNVGKGREKTGGFLCERRSKCRNSWSNWHSPGRWWWCKMASTFRFGLCYADLWCSKCKQCWLGEWKGQRIRRRLPKEWPVFALWGSFCLSLTM